MSYLGFKWSLDHPQTNSGPLIPLHSNYIQLTKRSQIALLWTDFGHQSASICDFLKIFVSHREYRRASIQRHRSHIWGPKLMVRVVPDHGFFIVGLSHFQCVIGHYTWLACKTDISEEVKSHQSNVISRLLWSLEHPQTNSGPLIPLHSNYIQ